MLDLGEHRLKDLNRPEQIFQVLGPDLPTDFPPLRTLDTRPNNLPVLRTPLVGGPASTLAGGQTPRCPSVDGAGADVRFCSPSAIASDGTNLYVAEGTSDHGYIVRKVVIATGAVTTLVNLPGPQHARALTTDGTSLFAVAGRQVLKID